MDDTSRMAEMCADAWRSMYAYTEAFDKQPKGSATVQVAVLDLVNWCQVAAMAERHTRTHHAEIAAAVRDARGERSESWEVWQDDMPVAGSDSIADAKHYLMMYGQDGPVKLVRKVEYRETVTPEQITAMRAGEGEG